jgi:hypothetical protein
MLDGPGGELHAVFEPESVEYLRHVICGRPDGDDQFPRDLAVGTTARDESDNLALTRCKCRQCTRSKARREPRFGIVAQAQRGTAQLRLLASNGAQMTCLRGEPVGALAELQGALLEKLGLGLEIRRLTLGSSRTRVRECIWLVFNQEQRHTTIFARARPQLQAGRMIVSAPADDRASEVERV